MNVYLCLPASHYHSQFEREVTAVLAAHFHGLVTNLHFHAGTQEMETFETIEKADAFIIATNKAREVTKDMSWGLRAALACKKPVYVLEGNVLLYITKVKIDPYANAA